VAVSDAVLRGHLDWRWLRRATPEATQTRLESVRGIGPWTAAYVRMRALGDRDAFLPTDLGIVKAFARLAGPAAARSPERILARAEPWRPWRAYATLHLWRSLAES
jgi:3-methyladenine DNA glycosylase/8-oxoguanine DNA glycosylase